MSVDLVEEKENTLARLRVTAGGRWWEEAMPDSQRALVDDDTADLRPFGVITWGTPYPTYRDRSMMGEESQPYIVPMHIQAIAATVGEKNALAGAVRTLLLGWAPHAENASGFTFRGGGEFNNRIQNLRPTRFIELVNFETQINLSTMSLFNPASLSTMPPLDPAVLE